MKGKLTMNKFLSMTVLLLIIVLAGCQKDQTTKPKQKTNTNDAKVVKTEKLETMSYEDFYENLKEEELNDLDIIQVADQKITAVIGNYFLVLNENKKNHTYKINKIIDLHPYGMNYYYNEESTMFYPSKDGEKYLIYNECRYNSKDQTINAKDDKELKSIVIDLKKDEVTYRKGNHLENLKKKEGVSENNYPKIAKFSKDMKQYAKKKKYELMTNFYLKSGKDRFWVMKPFYEENILEIHNQEYRKAKRQCSADVIRASQSFYDTMMNKEIQRFYHFNDTPLYFRNGIIHTIANDDTRNLKWDLSDE